MALGASDTNRAKATHIQQKMVMPRHLPVKEHLLRHPKTHRMKVSMTDKKNETSKPVLVPGIGQDGYQPKSFIPQQPKPENVTKPIAPPPKQP